MPELPEVETVRRGLEHWVQGRTLTSIEALHPRATNPRSIAPLDLATGSKVLKISRRGKFLWFELDQPFALVAHLGMSGQFRVQPLGQEDEKHLRVRIGLDKSRNYSGRASTRKNRISDQFELRFIDQRTFGWLALSNMNGSHPELVAGIAPDVFDPEFDISAVIKKIRAKKSEIKRVLLDQSVMSGVGNIYADESLWLAKIHPHTMAHDLSAKKIQRLIEATSTIMSQALLEGGTSFDSLYTNVNGESGYFERSLQVYGQENQPCSSCHTLIVRIEFANRSSRFCPRCQKVPVATSH